MTISEAKKISIVSFLESLGYHKVKHYGRNYMFLSPFRNESRPSFAVRVTEDVWFDYGIGEGGNIIDLCLRLYNTTDISVILHKLESFAPFPKDVLEPLSQSHNHKQIAEIFQDIEFCELNHRALLSYLMYRCIDFDVAQKFCREVHYSHLGKRYFGIAFENRSHGCEIRNPYIKQCLGKKDISVISTKRTSLCLVFEGFMDFLSYMTLLKRGKVTLQGDYIVLNSVSTIKKSVDILSRYATVHCYLDNDAAGAKTTKLLASIIPGTVVDESGSYNSYKDLNDYLRNNP